MNRAEFIKTLFFGAAGLGATISLKNTGIFRQQRTIRLLDCHIAGFQYYEGEAVLPRLNEGSELRLVREADNPYDDKAVAIYYRNHKLGFIPRSDNEVIANMIDQQISPSAKVTSINTEYGLYEAVGVEVYKNISNFN